MSDRDAESAGDPNVEQVDSARLAELERKAREADWVDANYAYVIRDGDHAWVCLSDVKGYGPTWLDAVELAMQASEKETG